MMMVVVLPAVRRYILSMIFKIPSNLLETVLMIILVFLLLLLVM